MSALAWIALAAYLLVWLVMVGVGLEVVKQAKANGEKPRLPAWTLLVSQLAWPVWLALAAGRRIGKTTELNSEQ